MRTYILALSISLLTMFTPIVPFVLLAFAAIILDLYFGLWKTIRLFGWRAVRSRRLSDTITKTLLYVGGIVMIFLAETFVLKGLSEQYTNIEYILTKAFTLFCLTTEAKSINESYHAVTGKNIWASFVIFVQRARQEENKKK
jgi:hypothetical protein